MPVTTFLSTKKRKNNYPGSQKNDRLNETACQFDHSPFINLAMADSADLIIFIAI